MTYFTLVVELHQGQEPGEDSWEELPELGVVDNKGHECAEADDAVRVRPEEVVAARVEVGRLDHADREVVDGVLVGREAAHRTETARQEGEGLTAKGLTNKDRHTKGWVDNLHAFM